MQWLLSEGGRPPRMWQVGFQIWWEAGWKGLHEKKWPKVSSSHWTWWSTSYVTPKRGWGIVERYWKRGKAGKEKMWTHGKMVEKEETNWNSLCLRGREDERLHGYPAARHPLDLGEAPITWEVAEKGIYSLSPLPHIGPQAHDLHLVHWRLLPDSVS